MSETPRLPPFYHLIVHDSVGSTNDVARELAGQGAADGTVVWAERQTAGRGRLGRRFASPPGNLYVSFVLRPAIGPAVAPQLSFVAAVALVEAARAVLPGRVAVSVKWPNDVLVDGRKVAGILLEAATTTAGALDFVVLGIGVNVTSHPADTAYGATDLTATGAAVTVPALLARLADALLSWRGRWLADGFAPVRAAWLAHARGLGAPIDVRLGDTLISGRFADLDADGALIVESAGGARQRVTAGDVVDAALQA
ncbi:MAG: biotin--[acetyl-CoA-carboxylase] ligase [Proteobacteria bacterium]|nr:biotin--[acetyl-CoA-carboxylase] ligase [Pseudomonadota bacterium]